jgi:cardiolipin synthase
LITALTPAESLSLDPRRVLSGHRVRLLLGGAEAYPAMLDAITSAEREILLETYIWASDHTGRRFIDAVCIKAQEGVRVRCIIDGAGSFGFSSHDVERMRNAGVRLSVFHPVGPWRARWGWSVRDHRKLLIVDGRIAFAGGMNLGDDYAPLDWGGKGWNDIQVAVEGPVVRELLRLFEVSWRYAMPETYADDKPEPFAPRDGFLAIQGSTSRVHSLAVGRFFGRKIIQHHLTHAFSKARDHIRIQAAYFVPNRRLRLSLIRAARRGVDVRIMMPKHNDVPFLGYASRATWAPLLRNGVKLFEWLPGMLHSKTASVDGEWCMVGSYNLDARSLHYNWEVSIEVLDPAVAVALEAKFTEDEWSCEQVDGQAFRHRGMWQRVRERFFHLFRLWL